MSAGQHWLGDAELWGLTPARFGEIRDELEDHVQCVSAREGEDTAEEQREALSTNTSRRRLNAPHLADQVYATLNRWPTRREWREFMWLGIWFALIVLSDWLSLQAQDARGAFAAHLRQLGLDIHTPFPASTVNLVTAAWLLQAVARAGFFASFAISIWRALRTGWGVALARIMQLKLIHTFLVVTANAALGARIWDLYYEDVFSIPTHWPLWLTSPVIAAVPAVGAILVWIVWRRRFWHYGLGLALCAFFLYPGGPYLYHTFRVQRTLAVHDVRTPAGEYAVVPESDPVRIADVATRFRKSVHGKTAILDEANNSMTCTYESAAPLLYHVACPREFSWFADSYNWYPSAPWSYDALYWINGHISRIENILDVQELSRQTEVRSPLSVPGAGLSWLAAPIPILGIIGFLGLVLVMGRRSLADMLLYSFLTLLALVLTILPFTFTHFGDSVDLSFRALVYTPCPSFRYMLSDEETAQKFMLSVGLVLSAGIPWLLTSLFLRPGSTRDQGPDEAIAD